MAVGAMRASRIVLVMPSFLGSWSLKESPLFLQYSLNKIEIKQSYNANDIYRFETNGIGKLHYLVASENPLE